MFREGERKEASGGSCEGGPDGQCGTCGLQPGVPPLTGTLVLRTFFAKGCSSNGDNSEEMTIEELRRREEERKRSRSGGEVSYNHLTAESWHCFPATERQDRHREVQGVV